MTLPPVVSDAEVCDERTRKFAAPGWRLWHVWGWDDDCCRYCGGRKPTDAAPSSEMRS